MSTVPAIPIPKRATNGDMIKAVFGAEDIDEDFMMQTITVTMSDARKTFGRDWWYAPYEEIETEKTKEDHKKMKTERAMEILNNVVNFVSAGNDTGDTINELLKYGFEAEELVNDFNFSKIDVEDGIRAKLMNWQEN